MGKLRNLSSTSASSNSKFNHRLQKEKSLDTRNWRRKPVVINTKLPKAFISARQKN